MSACASCNRRLLEHEMKKDEATRRIEAALGGMDPDDAYVPNLMSRTAMRCEGCGAWICCDCAERAVLGAGAGSVKHTNCGRRFRNPT